METMQTSEKMQGGGADQKVPARDRPGVECIEPSFVDAGVLFKNMGKLSDFLDEVRNVICGAMAIPSSITVGVNSYPIGSVDNRNGWDR